MKKEMKFLLVVMNPNNFKYHISITVENLFKPSSNIFPLIYKNKNVWKNNFITNITKLVTPDKVYDKEVKNKFEEVR